MQPIAEEMEVLGRGEEREVVQLPMLSVRLLKWACQPDEQGRGCRLRVETQRRQSGVSSNRGRHMPASCFREEWSDINRCPAPAAGQAAMGAQHHVHEGRDFGRAEARGGIDDVYAS